MNCAILDMHTLKVTKFATRDEMKNAICDLMSRHRVVKAFVYHAAEATWTESEIA